MKLLFTKLFIRAYRDLPQRIQRLTDKQLGLLLTNPQHPSLRIIRIKKMEDPGRYGKGASLVLIDLPFRLRETPMSLGKSVPMISLNTLKLNYGIFLDDLV